MRGSRILGSYQITYANNGFAQEKHLVSEEDWNNILSPIKNAISIIEDDNNRKENEESRLLKSSLKVMFGDYNSCFIVGSPLHESIKTGVLSGGKYQGDHNVSWVKL